MLCHNLGILPLQVEGYWNNDINLINCSAYCWFMVKVMDLSAVTLAPIKKYIWKQVEFHTSEITVEQLTTWYSAVFCFKPDQKNEEPSCCSSCCISATYSLRKRDRVFQPPFTEWKKRAGEQGWENIALFLFLAILGCIPSYYDVIVL